MLAVALTDCYWWEKPAANENVRRGNHLVESDTLGNTQVEYIWLGNQRIAMAQAGSFYLTHVDNLGTVQLLTNSIGAIVWSGDYKPFGEVTITNSTVTNNLRLPGQMIDNETGLHYNYFRDYDPSIGRYAQSDPLGLGDGVNTYTYVLENPLVNIDLYGLFCIPWPSDTSPWTEGKKKYTGKKTVLPSSFGGFGNCLWKREFKQERFRTVTKREICYECTEKCGKESCEIKIKRGASEKEKESIYDWDRGANTPQIITGMPGSEQGCCKDPWSGAQSCGPIN